MLFLNLILIEAIPHRRHKRFLPNLFGSYSSTEPPATTVVSVTPKPTYFIPGPDDSNMSPTFIPAVPISYFTAANGQHFIVVRPVPSDNGPAYSNNIPLVKKTKRPLKKLVAASHFLGLSSTEMLELNQLAKIIGVKDMHDLPPLEEVMTLLGTTSKSETIKAVRDYASTPGGLELIKDYVLSYQPVKRMDTYQEKNSVEEGTNDWAIEYNDDEYDLDPNTNTMDGNLQPSQEIANSTPTPEPGFFEKLRSFLTFGYYTQAQEPKSSDQDQTLLSAKLVPHFIIPVKPIMPVIDKTSITSNLQRYPLTPFIQDMNPFAMKPVPIEPSSTIGTTSTAQTNMEHNETYIHTDGKSIRDIEDNVSLAKQPHMQISSPDEPSGLVNEILNSTDSPKIDTAVMDESSTSELTTVA